MGIIKLILVLCTLVLPVAYASEDQCATDGTDYYYAESVDGSTRSVSVNNCLNHGVKKSTKIENTFKVPQNPKYDPSVQLSLSKLGAAIGITQSGAQVFSAYLGDQIDAVDYSTTATAVEGDSFDFCDGHMNAAGNYHIHMPPSCLLRQKGMAAGRHSPQIGWAADGFPIYGPLGVDGTLMMTCTETGGTEGTDICTDECAGYYGDIGDGYMYRYYMQGEWNDGTCCVFPKTYTEENDAKYFPFSPYCLRGCCPSGATCELMPKKDLPSCSDAAEDGVVAGFDSSYTLPALPVNPDSCNTAGDMCNSDARNCGETCEYSTTVFGPAPPPSPPSPPPSPPSPPAPPSPPPCESWCDGNTKEWETKCGWGGSCAGCDACYYPPSPPAPPPSAPCSSWCEGNTNTEEKKCGWNSCSGCGFCVSPPPSPPPPPPPPCKSWCEGHTNENKCNWENCMYCDFCVEASATHSSLTATQADHTATATATATASSFISLLEVQGDLKSGVESPHVSHSLLAAVFIGVTGVVIVGATGLAVRRRAPPPSASDQKERRLREEGEKTPLKLSADPRASGLPCPA